MSGSTAALEVLRGVRGHAFHLLDKNDFDLGRLTALLASAAGLGLSR